jgi:NAD(P)-dependent dehydrogenase (short-subunit alcohol dehydrogenase family)
LVTGAARRIGRALALAVAGAGYDVAVHHLQSHDDADSLAGQIGALGRRCHVLSADLAQPAQARGLVAQAAAVLGPVSLLINNASTFDDDRIDSFDDASWTSHMEVNLHAPLILAQEFAAQSPDGGLILNLLDQRVWNPNPQFFTYSLSKAALWSATRTLAQALAPRIRVNGIGPGPTLPSVHQTPAMFQAEAAHVPLERRAEPADIVGAALYLIDAATVTGQMIAVDGGQHLSWRTPDIVHP